MAITEAYVDTGSTISNAEYSLPNDSTTPASIADDGVYQVFLDVSAMAANDAYRIRVKEKVYGAGTQRVVYDATLIGVQASPVWVSPSLILLHGWDVTVIRTAGADRSFAWSIRKVA